MFRNAERIITTYLWAPKMSSQFDWARYALPSEVGYEVSSQGDKRFSAFHAIVRGRSIEEHYQIKIKGYGSVSEGKGKPPKDLSTNLWGAYLALWREWSIANTMKMLDLREKATGKILTDKFATTNINQARALATLLNGE